MPRKPSPKSLKQLCFDNVNRNLDSFWEPCSELAEEKMANSRDVEKSCSEAYAYYYRPLENLPSTLVNELVNVLQSCRSGLDHYYNLLITSHMEHLKLRVGRYNHASEDICASQRCASRVTSLVIISLDKQWYSRGPWLENCLAPLTRVRRITICINYRGRSVLFLVGRLFPELEELYVSCDRGVNLRGFKSLFLPENELGIPDERYGKCRRLRKLSLRGLAKNLGGIGILLDCLPNLTRFEYSNSVNEISDHYCEALEKQKVRKQYSIDSLSCRDQVGCKASALCNAIKACPLVKKVELQKCACLENADLLALCHVPYLQKLTVAVVGTCPVTFAQGILPVLESHPELESLTLSGIPFVNVQKIASCCRNLRELSLAAPVFTTDLLMRTTNRLPLEKLNLVGDLSAKDLTLLLSAPELETVELESVENLTDCILLGLTKGNHLHTLQSLSLIRCSRLSVEGIAILLGVESSLRRFDLFFCSGITKADIIILKNIIKEHNWDLNSCLY